MANPIIKILRGATPPSATLQAGQLAMDQVAKNLYLGVEVGGVVTNEIVGGEGTFATKSYVDTAVSTGTGTLGTMSTQNADAVAITGGSIDNTVSSLSITGADISGGTLGGAIDAQNATITYGVFQTAVINSSTEITDSTIDGSPIGTVTPSVGVFTTLMASSAPVDPTDVVRKTELDDVYSAISDLGSVFHYAGNVSEATTPFDLSTLGNQMDGAYFRVDVAGTYTASSFAADSFAAKVGDAFVRTSTGFQKIDNVDVEVLGTANEIAVTGDENAGYTVALAQEFKDKVTELETKTQNIDHTGTSAGITDFGFSELTNVAAVYSPDILHLNAATEIDLIAPVQINVNAPIMKGDVAAPTTLENFIIDGGVY